MKVVWKVSGSYLGVFGGCVRGVLGLPVIFNLDVFFEKVLTERLDIQTNDENGQKRKCPHDPLF